MYKKLNTALFNANSVTELLVIFLLFYCDIN